LKRFFSDSSPLSFPAAPPFTPWFKRLCQAEAARGRRSEHKQVHLAGLLILLLSTAHLHYCVSLFAVATNRSNTLRQCNKNINSATIALAITRNIKSAKSCGEIEDLVQLSHFMNY